MKDKLLPVIVIFVFLMLIPIAGYTQSGSVLTIGLIDNKANGTGPYDHDGCGPYQIWPKGRARYGQAGFFYMLPYSNRTGNGALMYLDGKIVRLRHSGTNYPKTIRKGMKYRSVFTGSGYSITVDKTITKVYPESPHGTAFDMAAKITVKKGARNKSAFGVSFDGC